MSRQKGTLREARLEETEEHRRGRDAKAPGKSVLDSPTEEAARQMIHSTFATFLLFCLIINEWCVELG